MSTSFRDYVRDVEEQSTPEELFELNVARARARLGLRIHEFRVAAGLTQAELAARSGIAQADISRIERGQGNPTTDTLAAVGLPLGMTLEYVEKRELASA